ncbi:two-component sensor histidine kinase [Actinotalea ferrariae]|uniref:sensor histidine kinase n=1 Tax=Actinotalea ferrariae TaxID=1386098 RepID=UPI001C8B9037|nr:histidine kinase [Actinotalea ferrariae]MBX9246139.1 two-component sensor histidine kinase [Actinotalea ferrariae]
MVEAAPTPAPFSELSARRLGPVRRFFARHPVVVDVLVVLWFVVVALLPPLIVADGMRYDSIRANDALAEQLPWWTGALTIAGVVVLSRRRARPVAVAAAMTALGVVSLAGTGDVGGFDLGIALAVYAVAATHRPAVTWRTVSIAVAAVAGAGVVLELPRRAAYLVDGWTPPDTMTSTFGDPVARGDWSGATVALVVGVLLAVAIGTSVRNRRLHLADLVDRANALAREREQQARLARAAERATIAREMHDVVAHSLSVMIALGDGANAALDRSPDRSLAALAELSATGRTALRDIRRIFGVLGDEEGADHGGTDGSGAPYDPQPEQLDLAALVERFRAAGLPVRATGLTDPGLQQAGTALRFAVHRIVQEALTNALRYAPGTARVDLAVRRTDGTLEIEVVDRGPGVPVAESHGSGRGVIGMRERAVVHGGVVEAGPFAGGWRVRAALPWPGAG